MSLLPWGAMLRAAVRMGIQPQAFWTLSLPEWRWLCGEAERAMRREDLETLMRAFPDTKEMMNG